MICDSLKNAERYFGVSENLKRGLQMLMDTDFSTLENGKRVCGDDDVYMNVVEYESRLPELMKKEIHEEYIDIQYIVSGREIAGFSDVATMTKLPPEGDLPDAYFYEGAIDNKVLLEEDWFVVFFPGEAHGGGVMVDEPGHVRKAVVKVKV